MSYGPGRSPLVQSALVGAVLWLVGYVAIGLALAAAFGGPFDDGVGWLVVIYALVVIWFVVAAVLGPDLFLLVLVAVGVLSSLSLLAGGAVSVSWAEDITTPWAAAKVGAAVAIGHGFLMATALTLVDQTLLEQFTATTRTFSLVFGGFVVPAAFGAIGGLLAYARSR